MKFLHVCEVCGKEEMLTPEEAYEQGWDYPPKMGKFGVVCPHTCGDCPIVETVWWKLIALKMRPEDLSEKDKATLNRIINEPLNLKTEI